MSVKFWIKSWFFIILSILLLVGIFNYIIDPYWYFTHSNKWNSQQWGFDERQQKCNFIKNNKKLGFKSVILGNSRTTYLNSNDFNFTKAYNFAVSGMNPREYNLYIEFFKKEQSIKNLDYIIIGMDFFGTNNFFDTERKKSESYFKNSKFKIWKLLSLDMINYSIINIEKSKKNPLTCDYENSFYNRYNQKFMYPQKNRTLMLKRLKENIEYLKPIKYIYNSNIKKIWRELKQNNPKTKFIIFTTPVSEPFFKFVLRKAGIKSYNRWLQDLIDEFGIIYHFMDLNTIARNYTKNFSDGNHYYKFIQTMIVKRIMNIEDSKIPKDFGKTLTKKNIINYLDKREVDEKNR